MSDEIDPAVLEAADRNMVEFWIRMITATGGARQDREGLVLLSSGLPIPLFNPALLAGPVSDPDAAVAAAKEAAAARQVPFAVSFRDAMAPGLSAACEAAGLVEHWQPPLMVLDPIPDAAADLLPSPEWTAEPVDAANHDEYVRTVCAGFGMPYDLMAPALGDALLHIEGFTGIIGRVAGEAVAGSGVFVTGDTAGIYNVAVPPDHRRKGYGEAVTAAAARVGADGGARRAILQASEAGRPVYARMGYATPDRYRQFEPPA